MELYEQRQQETIVRFLTARDFNVDKLNSNEGLCDAIQYVLELMEEKRQVSRVSALEDQLSRVIQRKATLLAKKQDAQLNIEAHEFIRNVCLIWYIMYQILNGFRCKNAYREAISTRVCSSLPEAAAVEATEDLDVLVFAALGVRIYKRSNANALKTTMITINAIKSIT